MILIPLLLMFAGYVAFSILLFFFPTLLHKKMKYKTQSMQQAINGSRILKIAHRGGPRYVTQNTIEAFKHAEQYSDMFEMDVCETKDGVLVVHHDHDLLRTCGIKGFVRDYNYKDLPPFSAQIELNFAAEGVNIRSKSQKMPTLQQVFKQFPTMPINLQLKTPSKRAIQELVRLIHEYKRKETTIIGIRGVMQQQLKDEIQNGFRWMNDKDFYWLLFYYFTGMLPYVFIGEVSLQLPLCTEEFYFWKIREWGNNWKNHAYFKALKILNILIRPLVNHLHKRGIMVYYWVCNTQHDIKRAIKYGASGVMTDDPILLHNLVAKPKECEVTVSLQQNQKKEQ